MSCITDEQVRDMIHWAEVGHAAHLTRCEYEVAEALHELLVLRARYAIPENNRLCLGYADGRDGNLTATPHEAECPARDKDLTLRPYLYEGSCEEMEAP